TDANGRYFFTNLSPGKYTVHVAADNFKSSISINGGAVGPGPLYRKISLRGNQTTTGDDNLGEDGVDAQNPEQVGITAPAVTLVANAAPTGGLEGGFQGTSDDANDSNVNLTIDFGFATRLGVGNLVFRDANADGKYQSGIDTSFAGIKLELVYNDGGTGADTVVGSTTTDANGAYILYGPPAVNPQSYKVRIPASLFGTAGMLSFFEPSTLSTTGFDDNVNQNAQPAANPGTTGVVSASFSLVGGGLPTDTDGREAGYDKTSDNADDANNDLTIDFGLKAKALMVGNLVFRDVNANGTYESGIDLPVANVTVKLFQQAQAVTDTPVSTAVTAADGTYVLYATSPAAYYVHIPAAMFATGAPLKDMTSLIGTGNTLLTTTADTAKDDRFDENGADATQPAATGVSSGLINLAYGSMPLNSSVTATSGENGFESFMDDAADDSGIMTIDFGFQAGAGSPNAVVEKRNLAADPGVQSAPATFTAWQTQNSLSGLNHPNDDPDADGLTNLMEYALGTAGGNGLGAARFTLVNNTVTGGIDAVLTRPVGSHADVRYFLEGSNDLSTWTTLSLTPASMANGDMTETLRYTQVESAFNGASRGLLRIKVTLDANLDGTAEATATTGAQGWARMLFPVGRQSLSMPLLLPAIYTGQVSSMSDRNVVLNTNGGDIRTQLQNGVSYYLEVMDGALRGRTFDLDTTAATASSITLATAPESSLASARVRIRPHWTLGALLPVSGLQPATASEEADRLMMFDSATGKFQINWLQATSGGAGQWVRDGDAGLADDAARTLPPQAGMLVQIRSTPATLTFLGEVRTTALALPQTAGTTLGGTGLATPQTPASQPFTTGSRLRLWSGDSDPATAAYQNYLLNAQAQWVDEATGVDVSTQPLLDGFRAFFLVKP
ncbi:MAG: hypothetical protein JWR15_689, partial [Prosthecobacter sp.]|nr:hypothetical protein [Prosthecobacter sp.]